MMPSKDGENNRFEIPKAVPDKKMAFRRTLRVQKNPGNQKLQCRG